MDAALQADGTVLGGGSCADTSVLSCSLSQLGWSLGIHGKVSFSTVCHAVCCREIQNSHIKSGSCTASNTVEHFCTKLV